MFKPITLRGRPHAAYLGCSPVLAAVTFSLRVKKRLCKCAFLTSLLFLGLNNNACVSFAYSPFEPHLSFLDKTQFENISLCPALTHLLRSPSLYNAVLP